jgi:hypothetical protein
MSVIFPDIVDPDIIMLPDAECIVFIIFPVPVIILVPEPIFVCMESVVFIVPFDIISIPPIAESRGDREITHTSNTHTVVDVFIV